MHLPNKVNFDICFRQNASSAGVATTRVLQTQSRQVSSSLASGTATSITLGATTSLTPASSAAVVSQVRRSCCHFRNYLTYVEGGCLRHSAASTVVSQPSDRVLLAWLINLHNPAMSPHSRYSSHCLDQWKAENVGWGGRSSTRDRSRTQPENL